MSTSKAALIAEDTLLMMEELRAQGWLVSLKCSPAEVGWIIEGSRSEYDGPGKARPVYAKWCCEAQWLGKPPHRPSAFATAEIPWRAVIRVRETILEQEKAIQAREKRVTHEGKN